MVASHDWESDIEGTDGLCAHGLPSHGWADDVAHAAQPDAVVAGACVGFGNMPSSNDEENQQPSAQAEFIAEMAHISLRGH